jgi:hypothetical protein
VVSARLSSSTLSERFPAVVECGISRKVEWTWKVKRVTSSVAGSKSDVFFSVGRLKEHVFEVSLRTIKYLVARFHVAVTAYLGAFEKIPHI